MPVLLRLVALLALGCTTVHAQDALLLAAPDRGPEGPPAASPDAPVLTGDVQQDLLAAPAPPPVLPETGPFGREGYRNPALAFGLSAVLPGAGQVYNGSTIRAVAYAGLEVGLWAGYATWRAQGLDGLEAYEAYAHQHWDPRVYAEWLNNYPGYGGTGINLALIEGIDLTNPDGFSDTDWAAVRSFFEDLQNAERQSRFVNGDGTGTGLTFSHVLATLGEQQYYELIGKYFQYGPGWDDWCYGRDPDSPACYTIEEFNNRDQFAAKTNQFFDYAADHAAANTLLRRASRVSSIVLLNHVLAAFDALLTARFHNRGLDLDTSVSLVPDGTGGSAPAAQLRLTF